MELPEPPPDDDLHPTDEDGHRQQPDAAKTDENFSEDSRPSSDLPNADSLATGDDAGPDLLPSETPPPSDPAIEIRVPADPTAQSSAAVPSIDPYVAPPPATDTGANPIPPATPPDDAPAPPQPFERLGPWPQNVRDRAARSNEDPGRVRDLVYRPGEEPVRIQVGHDDADSASDAPVVQLDQENLDAPGAYNRAIAVASSDGRPPLARPIVIVRLSEDQLRHIREKALLEVARRDTQTCEEIAQKKCDDLLYFLYTEERRLNPDLR